MKNNKYPIVEVEWLDAQSGFSYPIEIDDVKNIEPFLTHSVGYLLREDKEVIILGFMLCDEKFSFKHWQLIPKGMVKKITILEEKK